jgi:hypothetical protein
MYFSRQELYELVWSKPMKKVAKEFGLSDVGFAKICRKNKVPTPPIGYWQRKQAGQNPRRIHLPNLKEEIRIDVPVYAQREHDQRLDDSVRAMYTIKGPLVVAESLQDPHPLVQQSLEVLIRCNPNGNGLLEPPKRRCLDVQVSPETVPRALRIMDTLIKGLEEIVLHVSLSETRTSILVDRTEVHFGISEELEKRWLEPKDHELKDWYQFGYKLYYERRFPTGNLFLTILSPPGLGGVRSWRDTKSRRLEDCLSGFVKGLLSVVVLVGRDVSDRNE